MDDNKDAVVINYPGATCKENELLNYTLLLYVKCNSGINKDTALPTLISKSECTYSVMLEVDKGCPIVSLSVILEFITMHTPLFSVGFIVLGVALGIFGRSMWPTVVFGLVTFSCIVVLMVLYILP